MSAHILLKLLNGVGKKLIKLHARILIFVIMFQVV